MTLRRAGVSDLAECGVHWLLAGGRVMKLGGSHDRLVGQQFRIHASWSRKFTQTSHHIVSGQRYFEYLNFFD
jgi:hypothetical protein